MTGFGLTSAYVDERNVVPELTKGIHGLLAWDTGHTSPALNVYFAIHGVDLQTSLKKNMTDRPLQSSV